MEALGNVVNLRLSKIVDWVHQCPQNEICRSIYLLVFCICILDFRFRGSVLLKFTLLTKFQGMLQDVCGKIRSNPISVLQYVKSGRNRCGELKFHIIFSYV